MTEPAFLVVKVGGSLVSDKRRPRNLDLVTLARYARLVGELARERPGRVAFVAGGGAAGHGAVRDLDAADPFAALGLTEATFTVRWAWTSAFRDAGVAAMPLQLAATCVLESGRLVVDGVVLQRLLAAGILPVLSGDCLLADGDRLEVFGSDRVPGVVLRAVPGPVRVVTLTDVPGVLTNGPGGTDILPYVDPDAADAAFRHLWRNNWDTSHSMSGKLRALIEFARQGAECVILKGDPTASSLQFLFRELDEWPGDVRYTRIAARRVTPRPPWRYFDRAG